LNRRIQKTVGSAVTKSFFNERWQELETPAGFDLTTYVWGPRYVDDIVLREKGAERLYSLVDQRIRLVPMKTNAGVKYWEISQ